jgi:hypothetical protein
MMLFFLDADKCVLPFGYVQLFQAEQRLQRSQQQLKDLRQAAADAKPESE